MNIIIPLGGLGTRFSKAGYNIPKPLIKLFFKPIVFWLLDNLSFTEEDNIYIIANPILKKYRFANEINKKYPQITVLYLENDTRGAAETLYLGTKNIRNANNEPVIVLDGDTFYNIDILKIYRECASKNAVVCFKQLDENPIYSYIKFNDKNKILKIAEKKKISSYANTGTYAFLNIHQLKKYCKHIIDNNQRDANEFYTSVVIRSMLEKDIPFESIVVEESDFEVLGTPE